MADKKSIMSLLNEIADMMEYKGENSFKINAYRNGANAIRTAGDDLDTLIKNKNLDSIKGIGKGLQSVIYEYYSTGTSTLYDELRNEIPDGIEQLLKVKGLSAKKIRQLYDELGIASIGELEYACRENRLALLKGFGPATQEKILREIENLKKYSNLVLLSTGHMFAEEIKTVISGFPSVIDIQLTGELRRGKEIISHIEFAVLVSEEKKFLKDMAGRFTYDKINKTITLTDFPGVPVSFHIATTPESFTQTLFISTGSLEFVAEVKKGKVLKGEHEEEFFRNLDLPYIIPEMREHEYFEYRRKNNSDLESEGLKGLLHFHTTWSDGRNTLTQMIKAASDKGYQFAAVCDHSKSAFYANGLNEERILLQYKEIRNVSAESSIRVIQGIESDILQDGSLDYDIEFLKNFKFVVASIHSRFKMDSKAMTARMLKAIENPYTDLLAHPSGRLLLSREPYTFDVIKIIDACAANNVAIEINSNPRRLDLDWRYIDYARNKGVLFSINSDAHSIEEIDLVRYGIIIGRKGGLLKKEVINYYSPEEFNKFVSRKINRKDIW